MEIRLMGGQCLMPLIPLSRISEFKVSLVYRGPGQAGLHRETLSSSPSQPTSLKKIRLGKAAQACSPSPREVEVGGSEVQGYPQLLVFQTTELQETLSQKTV